jgi:hypothetical protein
MWYPYKVTRHTLVITNEVFCEKVYRCDNPVVRMISLRKASVKASIPKLDSLWQLPVSTPGCTLLLYSGFVVVMLM